MIIINQDVVVREWFVGTKLKLNTTRNTIWQVQKHVKVSLSCVIGNPDAKIVKLKFVIPESVASPATCGYGFIDNVRVEDISSGPF